ncbi:retrovirus-related pol polyprotein from transposon TNT 1-94 [Tanacetum coccineum]
MAQRSIPIVLVRYSFTQKGYVLNDLITHKIITSRHVLFDETEFPFAKPQTPSNTSPSPTITEPTTYPIFPTPTFTSTTTKTHTNSNSHSSTQPETTPVNSKHTTPSHPTTHPNTPLSTSSSLSNIQNPTPPHIPSPRTSTRTNHQPTKLIDYQCKLPQSLIYNITKHHYTKFLNYSNTHTPSLRHLINNINKISEPHTYLQALKDPRWIEAINKEIQALEANHAWDITTLPPGKLRIRSKWVFRIKFKADGDIERFKARVVAKGFNNKECIDYIETFAPVAKMVSVKALIVVATHHNWDILQLDINNAFLHGDLDEEVYMIVPQGCLKKLPPNLVCKMKKSLYGLKQANRQWFIKLIDFLKVFGFHQSYADTSLFTLTNGSSFTALLIYVDDILLTGNDTATIKLIKQQLNLTFSIKDLQSLHYYLGVEILQNSTGLVMSQRKYALDLLQSVGLLNHKPSTIPMNPIKTLNATDGIPLADPSHYRP